MIENQIGDQIRESKNWTQSRLKMDNFSWVVSRQVPPEASGLKKLTRSSLVLLTKFLPVEVEDVWGVEKISSGGIAPSSLLLALR